MISLGQSGPRPAWYQARLEREGHWSLRVGGTRAGGGYLTEVGTADPNVELTSAKSRGVQFTQRALGYRKYHLPHFPTHPLFRLAASRILPGFISFITPTIFFNLSYILSNGSLYISATRILGPESRDLIVSNLPLYSQNVEQSLMNVRKVSVASLFDHRKLVRETMAGDNGP